MSEFCKWYCSHTTHFLNDCALQFDEVLDIHKRVDNQRVQKDEKKKK